MQGFNMGRYVPPDQEGVKSANALHKKHHLGARASKLGSQGALTVRFEMPFAIWCSTCPKETLIGQGVRFNAEKKKTGNYYSTPIYTFRMRHTACGGVIEIRTDPQNTAYVVVSGAKKRDTGEGKDADSLVKSGDFAIVTERERQDMRENAFANLEKTIADRAQLEHAKVRIEELQDAAAKDWEDPYTQNQKLRRAFRAGRKEREKEATVAENLKDRMSLGIDLLPGTEEDSRTAALVDFGAGAPEQGDATMDKMLSRPLFDTTGPGGRIRKGAEADEKHNGKLKAEMVAFKTRETLASAVAANTRVAKDPFLSLGSKELARGPARLPGIKRKRARNEPDEPPEATLGVKSKPASASALVSYDSDSD
jgi:coiled-coil domain-containing protein 130